MKDDKGMISPAALSALVRGDIENFMVAATPGGIEQQEKRGQAQVAHETLLPRKGLLVFDARITLAGMGDSFEEVAVNVKAEVEKLGITHEDKDDLFVKAKLPEGWKINPTESQFWSNLVDERGRQRAQIFYKAAFYDRDAFMRWLTRFYLDVRLVNPYGADPYDDKYYSPESNIVAWCLMDGDDVVWGGQHFSSSDSTMRSLLYAQSMKDVTEQFPDWQNPFRGWE